MNQHSLDQAGATLLVVDDVALNLSMLSEYLSPFFMVKVARNGEQALRIAHSGVVLDLILLDIEMPGLDGYAVCKALKADVATRDIPIIFQTARTDALDEQYGFSIGAADYIVKPINPPTLLARVRAHLAFKTMQDGLRDQNAYLEAEVQRRTQEVHAVQDVTILMMATLAETRDNETGAHILRTQRYVKVLALHLRAHPRFAQALSDEMIDLLYKSAPLHDIGKIGIPDHILHKPGKLDAAEFEIMKTHAALGRDAIELAERRLGYPVPFLTIAKEIAYGHQEKWNGTGYPQGCAGDAIPLSARLMAVADVYDALICKRVYKRAFTHEQAVQIIREGYGTHFDPDIAEAFNALHEEFHAIATRFADEAELS